MTFESLKAIRFRCILFLLIILHIHFFFNEYSLLDAFNSSDEFSPLSNDPVVLPSARKPFPTIFIPSNFSQRREPEAVRISTLTGFIAHKNFTCKQKSGNKSKQKNARYCQVKCLLGSFKWAQYDNGLCLCLQVCELRKVSSKDGRVLYEYSPPKYPVAVEVYTDLRCDPGTWTELECDKSPYDCMANVLRDPKCSKSWFAWSYMGDGNCYCIHKDVDCLDAKLKRHVAVATYLIVGFENLAQVESPNMLCRYTLQIGNHTSKAECLSNVLCNPICKHSHMVFDPGDCRCFKKDPKCSESGKATLYSINLERDLPDPPQPRFCMLDNIDAISDSDWLRRLEVEWNEKKSLSQILHFELDEGVDEFNRENGAFSDCPKFPLQSEKTDWACLYNVHSLNGIFKMDKPVHEMRSVFLSTDQSGWGWPPDSKFGKKHGWSGDVVSGMTSIFCSSPCANVIFEGCECVEGRETCFSPPNRQGEGCFVPKENSCQKQEAVGPKFWSGDACQSSCRDHIGPQPCYLGSLLSMLHLFNVSQTPTRTLVLGIEDHPWLSVLSNHRKRCTPAIKPECEKLDENYCVETFKWWRSWFDRIFYGPKDVDIPLLHAYPMGLTYSYIIGRQQQFYEAIRSARLDNKKGILAAWGSNWMIHGPESGDLEDFVKSN